MQGDIGADAGTGAAGHASATRNCLSNLDQAFVLYLNVTFDVEFALQNSNEPR